MPEPHSTSGAGAKADSKDPASPFGRIPPAKEKAITLEACIYQFEFFYHFCPSGLTRLQEAYVKWFLQPLRSAHACRKTRHAHAARQRKGEKHEQG